MVKLDIVGNIAYEQASMSYATMKLVIPHSDEIELLRVRFANIDHLIFVHV